MAKDDKSFSAEEMAKRGKLPAVLHFRPTRFRKVESPEELKNWEKLVLDRVGIHIQTKGAVWYETTCGTGNFDDCAEEDPGEQPSD
jgi:hypothetical protein